MKRVHVLILLSALSTVLLVVAILGLDRWLSGDGETPAPLDTASVVVGEPAPGPASPQEPWEPEELEEPEPGADPSPLAAPEAADQLRVELQADAPEDRHWVAGTVVLPEGCRADPDLQVFALTAASNYRRFARREASDPTPPGERATVAADGTFRLAFPADAREGWVMLRGRYLYAPRARHVDLTGDPTGDAPRLDLAARAGARLLGTVVLPQGSEQTELARVTVTVRSELGSLNTAAPGMEDARIELELTVDEQGRFELNGLPADGEYALIAEHPRLASTRTVTGGFSPCADRPAEVVLALGGSVRGRVVDEAGSGLGDVQIGAYRSGKFFGIDDEVVREAETAADGSFQLLGVSAGRVELKADGEGYLRSEGVPVEITEGEERSGLVVTLTRGNSVVGRVTWEDGSPVEGALVSVEFDMANIGPLDVFNALRGQEGRDESDEEGRFEVTGLGKGPFLVRARANAPLEPGSEGDDVRWTVREGGVAPGETELELVLHPPVGLRGRVVDDRGLPVTAFRVHLRRRTSGPMAGIAQEQFQRSQSFESEQGAFLMEGLERGAYELWIQDDDHVSLELVPVELPAEGELEVQALRTATLAGEVREPGGAPVEGASVTASGGSGSGGGMMALLGGGIQPPTTDSGPDGAFELRGVAPQRTALTAQHEDWARSSALDLVAAPGERVEGLVLLLAQGGTLTGEIFDSDGEPAAGRLVTVMGMDSMFAGGGPDQRVGFSDDGGLFRFEHLEPRTWQVTAIDQSREWAGDEGIDMAEVLSSLQMSQADVFEGEVTHVVLGAPPENPVRVFGYVTLDGEPFAPATVSFFSEGRGVLEGLEFGALDDDGRYEVVLDGPGRYVVNVQVLGGGLGQQTTIEFHREVPEVSDLQLDFALPLGRISGLVTDTEGEPASGVRVTVTIDGNARSDQMFGGQYSELLADDEGRFDLLGLRPGTYRVSAGGAALLGGGGDLGRVTLAGIELGEDEWIDDLELELPRAGGLDLIVLDAAGSPASGASVFVRDEAGHALEPFSMMATDASGRCRYEGLAPGSYTVLARTATHSSVEVGPVRVVEGARDSVELTLEQGTILWIQLKQRRGQGEPLRGSVRVVDEHGRDMAHLLGMADIQYLYGSGGFSPTEHRLGPLPPGRYVVHAEAEGRRASKPVVLRGEAERKLIVRLR